MGRRRPPSVEALIGRIGETFDTRSGFFWTRTRAAVPVAGYAFADSRDRVRTWRRDNSDAFAAVVVALLGMTDIRTGFIGSPRPGGGPWERPTLRSIAQFAYGSQTLADVRRVRRCLEVMESLQWIGATKQVRRIHSGGFASEAGVRRLNIGRIAEEFNLYKSLQRDRAFADQKHGTSEHVVSLTERRKQRREQRKADAARSAARPPRSTPPATGDPPRGVPSSTRTAEFFDAIAELLKS